LTSLTSDAPGHQRLLLPSREARRPDSAFVAHPLDRRTQRGCTMDTLYPRCCGLDIHKRDLVACLITPGTDGHPTKAIRKFGTMTADVLAFADWLTAAGCTHVAMESTGVYWKPIYNLLEESFTLLLVNARH